MANVQFEEDKLTQGRGMRSNTSGLAGFMVRKGIVGSVGQANMLLVLIAVIAIGASIYIYVTGQPVERIPTPAELESLHEMQQRGNQ